MVAAADNVDIEQAADLYPTRSRRQPSRSRDASTCRHKPTSCRSSSEGPPQNMGVREPLKLLDRLTARPYVHCVGEQLHDW
jgi:hypothetical protein